MRRAGHEGEAEVGCLADVGSPGKKQPLSGVTGREGVAVLPRRCHGSSLDEEAEAQWG